jgi:hypothetical protein
LGEGQLSAHGSIRRGRSWLINLPKETIYNWDQLYFMFIDNFQGIYEWPSTAETLKTVKDIKIINAFCNGVIDMKTVEEIAMKKQKIMVDLLTVTNECIKAFEA